MIEAWSSILLMVVVYVVLQEIIPFVISWSIWKERNDTILWGMKMDGNELLSIVLETGKVGRH